jgi:hypothetical protein
VNVDTREHAQLYFLAMDAAPTELEAAIERAPDDPSGYLALGAWLRARGDVRGDLIEYQHAGNLERANALLDAHRRYLWGPAADAPATVNKQEGARGRETRWRWGFLESLWVCDGLDYEARNYPVDNQPWFDTAQVLEGLLVHPSSRFLRELTIGTQPTIGDEDVYARVLPVIARHSRPTLRALTLGDDDEGGGHADIGNLASLAHMTSLEQLTLISRSLAPGPHRPPRVRELEVVTDPACLPELCAAPWPGLRVLRVRLGINSVLPAQLSPIFDGSAFPDLLHLDLSRLTMAPALAAALGSSRIARRLERLELADCALTDEDATALASGTFPRLRQLDASRNQLSPRGLETLKALCASVEVAEQDWP